MILPILNTFFLPCSPTRASCSNGARDSWISGYDPPPPPGVFVFPATGDDASDEDDEEEDACWRAEDDGCWRSGASWMSPCSLAEDMELGLFHVDAGEATGHSW